MTQKINIELNSDFYYETPHPTSPQTTTSNDITSYLEANKKLLDVVTFYKNKITNYYQNKSWDRYKKLTNEYEMIFTGPNTNLNISKYTPVSRSFFKLWEILHDFKGKLFDETTPINALFLAEGPGGFAEALMKYRQDQSNNAPQPKDTYYGMTLKSSNKNIPDWKYKSAKLTILYGEDNTGNLYNINNITHLKNTLGSNTIDFITADGGFDFSVDFNNQEELSFKLIACEIYAAIQLQKLNGTFIIKIFDIFTPHSLQLINILSKAYTTINMIKPLTSRPANSEKYLVCQGFKGLPQSDIDIITTLITNPLHTPPPDSQLIDTPVTRNIIMFNTFYISRQVLYIQRTLEYIHKFKNMNMNDTSIKTILDNHIKKVKKWCTAYNIPI